MEKRKKCFVLMPFKDDFNNPWEFAIKPAAEENDLDPYRADDRRLVANRITKDIMKSIIDAEIIIAEMTGQNPNVLYELGLAHSAKKRVIMITRNKEDIPFDIQDIRYILYDINQLPKLHRELSDSIKVLLTNIDPSKYDIFPELIVLTSQKESEIQNLKSENEELISLAHGIRITTDPSFAYIFFNNRYIGIAPQMIHVNPYHPRNVLTVFAIEHFEEYKVLSEEELKNDNVKIHIDLEKRNPQRYPERVHKWLKYIRMQPDDIVIGRAIACYLAYIGEHEESISQLKELLRTCDN